MTEMSGVAYGRSDRASAVSPPEFVGRGRELVDLAEALRRPPAVVLVEGEAGVGKSRLLREFAASSAGASVGLSVTGVCPPIRVPYTLGPVVDAVRQATDRVAGLGLSGLTGALRPLFPEWAADLPEAPEPAEDARAARHRLFRALVELLDCLGVTVLVVEDVHWADDATLEFLLFVTSCQPQPLSLVASYRPEDVPADSLLLRLSSRLPAGTTRARLTLGPFDVAETAELVSSMLGGERVSDEFAAFLRERTGGVPLVVEESVRLMHDRADLAHRDQRWVRRRLMDIDVPPTVRDAVLERCHRLGEDARTVLQTVAVLGDPSGEATLAAVSNLPAERLVAGLAEGLNCGLVQESERRLVSFRHVLAAKAVYEDIPGPRRRAMHLRAGRALETVSPVPVASLARHFWEAGDTSAWTRYAERAADAAVEAGDLEAAATLLYDLLSGADLPPDAVVPLMSKIPFSALAGTARLHDLAQALKSALESDALDAEQQGLARYWLGRVLDAIDDYDASRTELERAIPHLRPGSLELVNAMLLLGWPRGSSCPGWVHRDWLRRAADAACSVPRANQPDITVRTAIGLLLLDEPEGYRLMATVPDEVSTRVQRRTVTHRDVNMADLAMRWGRYAEARKLIGNTLAMIEEHGYHRYRELVLTTRIHLDWFTGNWDGLAERAAELAGAEDTVPMNRLRAILVGCSLSAAKGGHGDAEATLGRVLTQMRELGAVETLAEPAAALARMRLAAGRPEDALKVTEEPIGVIALKETWLWATDVAPARVDALVAAGRLDEAAELVAAFGDGVRGRNAPAAQAAWLSCEGILASGRGAPEQAAAALARAAEAWDALPRPYDALLARERRAYCLLAAGEGQAGRSLLAEVINGLTTLGAQAVADRVRDGMHEHGKNAAKPRRGGRPGYGDRLSPRELEVVRLVVDGRTNRQIAEALTVSRQTVDSHVHSAMRKLRVSSRTALAVSAIEHGLAKDEDTSRVDE